MIRYQNPLFYSTTDIAALRPCDLLVLCEKAMTFLKLIFRKGRLDTIKRNQEKLQIYDKKYHNTIID